MNILLAATVTFGLAFSSGVALAQSQIDLRGFQPGASLEEVQEHAGKANLELNKSTAFPDIWTIEGTNLSLFVCSGKVASVRIDIEGGVDEFGDLVSTWQHEFGLPELQILSFDAGATRVTNIDARFSHQQASHLVQLHSYDGEVGISASVGSAIKC